MKTKKSILWLLGLMLCATPVLTACSDDDDDNKNGNSSQEETVKCDDLAYFQNAICRIDSAGYLVDYNIGQALYESEPQHLYIGVDDIEEAAKWFRRWIAPDVELGNNNADLTAQLTDTLGHAQGTIYFKAGTGQSVAEVTYSPETQLKYIDRITFLLNSAWPFNSGGTQWHKGDIRTMPVTGAAASSLDYEDKTLNWVLIREGGNGVKPMWCAITKNSYNACWQQNETRPSRYCPSYSTAKEISDILRSDYAYFISKFKEAGCGELSYTESYWIDYQTTGGFMGLETYTHMMLYSSPDYYTNGAKGVSPSQPFLLKIDWFDDGEQLLTATAGTNFNSAKGCFNIFDGDWSTYWMSWFKVDASDRADGSGKCVYVEFSGDGPILAKRYYMTYNALIEDFNSQNPCHPTEWKLYGKKNSRSKTWQQIDYRKTDELGNNGKFNIFNAHKTFHFDVPESAQAEYQFFRLELWNTASSLDLYGYPVGISRFGFE
jgi:hypothetical protein